VQNTEISTFKLIVEQHEPH